MILSRVQVINALQRALPGGEPEDLDLVARATLAAHVHGQEWAGLALLGNELASNRRVPAEASGVGGFRRIAGEGSPGPVVMASGVREAGVLAVEFGVAAVGLAPVGGTGRLASYAAALASRGLVGMIFAHSTPRVAPFGGNKPAIGTNPFCLAAPRSDGLLVIDAATSQLTSAALARHRANHEALREGTALDIAGRPTVDAEAAATLTAKGLIGSLVGLAIEVAAGALLAMEDGPGRGILVVGLDPRAVGTELTAEVDRIATRWQEAGGHLPGAAEQLPESAEVAGRDWAAFLAEVGQ